VGLFAKIAEELAYLRSCWLDGQTVSSNSRFANISATTIKDPTKDS